MIIGLLRPPRNVGCEVRNCSCAEFPASRCSFCRPSGVVSERDVIFSSMSTSVSLFSRHSPISHGQHQQHRYGDDGEHVLARAMRCCIQFRRSVFGCSILEDPMSMVQGEGMGKIPREVPENTRHEQTLVLDAAIFSIQISGLCQTSSRIQCGDVGAVALDQRNDGSTSEKATDCSGRGGVSISRWLHEAGSAVIRVKVGSSIAGCILKVPCEITNGPYRLRNNPTGLYSNLPCPA